jgi:hypothetical protein
MYLGIPSSYDDDFSIEVVQAEVETNPIHEPILDKDFFEHRISNFCTWGFKYALGFHVVKLVHL